MSEKKWHWVIEDQGGWPFVSKEPLTEAEAHDTWRASGRVVTDEEWTQIQHEIATLKDALRYYATNKHYTLDLDVFGTKRIHRVEDGAIARKALGDE